MRDKYIGYYPPTSAELDRLWSDGLIVLDTNALLGLYRYSEETRKDLLDVMKKSRERLWIPFQVGLEFQDRRLDVIYQQRQAYDEVLTALDKNSETMIGEIRKYKRHASLPAEKSISLLTDAVAKVREDLATALAAHENHAPSAAHGDAVWDEITEIFSGRVGDGFTEDELADLYADGRTRYESKTPPGFKDQDKDEPARYGDLVIWKEILRHAKAQGLDTIFVTDDSKPDWWNIHHGKTVGPRVELVEEFHSETGRRVHFYGTLRFLEFANARLSATVSDKSLEEVEQYTQRQVNLARLHGEHHDLIIRREGLEAELEDARRDNMKLRATMETSADLRERASRISIEVSKRLVDIDRLRLRLSELEDFRSRIDDSDAPQDAADLLDQIHSIRDEIEIRERDVSAHKSELNALHARVNEIGYPVADVRKQSAQRIRRLKEKLDLINDALARNEVARLQADDLPLDDD